jgi:hypothetical protein
VTYDCDHGRKEEAFRLAREAAATYSGAGLGTLARLLERTGDLVGAERYFRAIFDRYESSPQFLIGFYRRHVEDPGLRSGLRRLEVEVFPRGLARARGEATPSPPEDGVLITGSSPSLAEAGLQPGNVIVALDGYRVRDLRPYNWIRFLSPHDAPMRLTVWAGAGVREIQAHPRERWFDATMENYRPDHP